jgi:hypothetical protein
LARACAAFVGSSSLPMSVPPPLSRSAAARWSVESPKDVLGPVIELAVVGVGVGHARAALFGRERAEHLAQDGGARVGVGVEPRQEVGDGRGGQGVHGVSLVVFGDALWRLGPRYE